MLDSFASKMLVVNLLKEIQFVFVTMVFVEMLMLNAKVICFFLFLAYFLNILLE